MSPIKVLVLDDEISILKAIRRVLMREGFEVEIFSEGNEALEYLKEGHEVHVLLSDMRMPNMTGSQFLEQALIYAPLATRIILSGYSEEESLLKAINQGKIWRFLSKPWNNHDLVQTIINAAEVYSSKKMKEELLATLDQKNKELQSLNESLESQVEDRTLELYMRNDLMEQLIDGVDIKVLLSKANDMLNCITSSEGFFVKCNLNTNEIPEEHVLIIKKAGETLGYISNLNDAHLIDVHEESLSRCMPVITLILHQHRTDMTSQVLIDKMETWLGEGS